MQHRCVHHTASTLKGSAHATYILYPRASDVHCDSFSAPPAQKSSARLNPKQLHGQVSVRARSTASSALSASYATKRMLLCGATLSVLASQPW